jgi:hypothetical protein
MMNNNLEKLTALMSAHKLKRRDVAVLLSRKNCDKTEVDRLKRRVDSWFYHAGNPARREMPDQLLRLLELELMYLNCDVFERSRP